MWKTASTVSHAFLPPVPLCLAAFGSGEVPQSLPVGGRFGKRMCAYCVDVPRHSRAVPQCCCAVGRDDRRRRLCRTISSTSSKTAIIKVRTLSFECVFPCVHCFWSRRLCLHFIIIASLKSPALIRGIFLEESPSPLALQDQYLGGCLATRGRILTADNTFLPSLTVSSLLSWRRLFPAALKT